MIEIIKNITSKKIFHICMIFIIIIAIISLFIFLSVKYEVEGETQMPFYISKISIISTVEGIDRDDNLEKRWSLKVNQNNDIYFYIENNLKENDKEIIKKISIENIKIKKEKTEGLIKLYKPNLEDKNTVFKNTTKNEIENISFDGDINSDLKNLKISNQGGIVAFRYANNEIAEYSSNEESINHQELLKKANIQENSLKAQIEFDFIIQLDSGKEYISHIYLETPVEGVVEKGNSSIEITDISKFIFKRKKNT